MARKAKNTEAPEASYQSNDDSNDQSGGDDDTEDFAVTAGRRVTAALKALKSVAKLGLRSPTDAQYEQVFDALETALNDAKHAWQNKSLTSFVLK